MTHSPRAAAARLHQMAVADRELSYAMMHIANAARAALVLGLKPELVAAKDAVTALHTAVSKLHRESQP